MPPDLPLYTVLFIAAAVTVIIGVDIYLLYNRKDGDTISEVIRNSARRWPIFYVFWGLFWGVLLGHWFW
jgi:hypothetical protein